MKTATTEEWIEIGKLSADLNNKLVDLICKLSPHVTKNSKCMNDLRKADRAITQFLSDAESEMFRQHAEPDNNPLDVFYGTVNAAIIYDDEDLDKK